MNILQINSSISGDGSITQRLSRDIVARLLRQHADARVVTRDLARHPLPYFDATSLAGIGVTPRPQGADHQAEAELDAAIVDEFMRADVVVVGVPMYNFGIPAQLKTWIDYLAVAGVTFRYTAEGAQGLAGDRRVILVSARGGTYAAGSPQAALEHQESYLRAVFGFFGITRIDIVRAEGVRLNPDAAAKAIGVAEASIAELRP